MRNPEVINWTEPMLKRFIKAYENALSNGHTSFQFDGHGFLTAYAKYLIEYLKGEFKWPTKI